MAERPELRNAFEAFVGEALEVRRRHYGQPILIEGPPVGPEWNRADQTRFVGATRTTYTGLPQGPSHPLQLEVILAFDLLEPLIAHTRSFQFDRDRFEELYARIEADLLSDRVIHVTWVPLLGVDPTAEVSRVELGTDGSYAG